MIFKELKKNYIYLRVVEKQEQNHDFFFMSHREENLKSWQNHNQQENHDNETSSKL